MHHAYLYEGPLRLLSAIKADAISRYGFEGEPILDITEKVWEKFGIEEARELQEEAQIKPLSGRALFFIGVASMTHDAQQALLKLFEEPQPGVIFVLLAPFGTVMSTLRSRFADYPVQIEDGADISIARKFLKAGYKDRSSQISAMLKEEEGERERVRDFLNGMEKEIHAALLRKPSDKSFRESLEDISKVRAYANDRSASFKMLLEHLAVTLPAI